MKQLILGSLIACTLASPAVSQEKVELTPEQIAAAKKSVPELIKDLTDKKDAVRLAAVQVLADRGPKAADAVPGLVAVMHSLNEDLRLNAAVALAAGSLPLFVGAKKSLPITDFKSFIAYARQHQKSMNYGSAGIGSSGVSAFGSLPRFFK